MMKSIAEPLAIILRQQGFEVFALQSGYAALERAATCIPDLLITDVPMPEIGGVELAALMLTLHPKCKVICFSGHARQEDLLVHPLYRDEWECPAKSIHPHVLVQKVAFLGNATDSRRTGAVGLSM